MKNIKEDTKKDVEKTLLALSLLQDSARFNYFLKVELKKLEDSLINTILDNIRERIFYLSNEYDLSEEQEDFDYEIELYLKEREKILKDTISNRINIIRLSIIADIMKKKLTVTEKVPLSEKIEVCRNRLLFDCLTSLQFGGSLIRSLKPSVTSELNRLLQEVPKIIGKLKGIVYARWILNPNHPYYPYYEICEQYTFETFVDINDETARLGLEGLHYLDKVPSYPHPHCGCSIRLIQA